MSSLSVLTDEGAMRYLRVCLGSEEGDPGMTLYEIDEDGWVHRQVQLCAQGSRFTPENILMCSPVNLEAMASHPAAEEIDAHEFELLWGELAVGRDFMQRVPDPDQPWWGEIRSGNRVFELQWLPSPIAPRGWTRVPGFARLFAHGDRAHARAACASVFVDGPIAWSALQAAA